MFAAARTAHLRLMKRLLRRGLTRLQNPRRDHRRVRELYLRGLGVVALLSFTSLRRQLPGLLGEQGISPASELLAELRRRFGRARPDLVPTLFWLDASDRTLLRAARAGQVLGALLAAGVAPGPCALALTGLELSFVKVGSEFLGFQWEALLIENLAHAALLAPWGLRLRNDRRVSRVDVALMRALLFRLHFESGLVKVKSRDRAWLGLEAMSSYYETAPLPSRLGWYAHHLPGGFQRASTAAALGIECGAPVLGLAWGPTRALGFALLDLLQGLIAATGNYGFFNLLTLAMNLWYLDDAQLARALPPVRPAKRRPNRLHTLLASLGGGAVALAGTRQLFLLTRRTRPLRWAWLRKLEQKLTPFELANAYGPFSLMTRSRPELAVEGSDDGVTWKRYRFRYKIDDPMRAPRQVAPHQPRLDWQMWFAALDPVPPWFLRFVKRLLEGSEQVLKLLGENPFPDRPPKWVRTRLEVFRMASLPEHRKTGAWWTVQDKGEVMPPLSLRSFEA